VHAERPATVLVVEDDPQLRRLYRQALVAARYNTTTVADGLGALASIDAHMPDVVVLDLGLPQVSGWDVYRELRARPGTRALPIIVVSGNVFGDIDPRDPVWLLTKPIVPDELVEAVDKALGMGTL
jgi:CheY-like chemotaxis protein